MATITETPSFITNLMGSTEYSDMTLKCEGQEFKAHKVVICSQSPVFAAALGGRIRVVPANEPDVVGTGELNVEGLSINDDQSTESLGRPSDETGQATVVVRTPREELLDHVRVNAIADYYGIPALCQLSSSKMRHSLQTAWSSELFLEVVKESLASTCDGSLHGMLGSLTGQHLNDFRESDSFSELELPGAFTKGVLHDCARRLREADMQLERTRQELKETRDNHASASRDRELYESMYREQGESYHRLWESVRKCHETLSAIKLVDGD